VFAAFSRGNLPIVIAQESILQKKFYLKSPQISVE